MGSLCTQALPVGRALETEEGGWITKQPSQLQAHTREAEAHFHGKGRDTSEMLEEKAASTDFSIQFFVYPSFPEEGSLGPQSRAGLRSTWVLCLRSIVQRRDWQETP